MFSSHSVRALLAAGILPFLSGCGTKLTELQEVSARTNPELPVVAVVRPSPQTLAREIRLTGEFRPWQQANLHAKVAGYLKHLYVDVGTRVRAGQLIGVIEAPELEAERSERRAAIDLARAEATQAEAQIQRAKAHAEIAKATQDRLVAVNRKEPGLVAGQEIDEASSRLAGATAELRAAEAFLLAVKQRATGAEAALQRIETMLEYCKITAPFDGVVTKRLADPGNMIQAGTASTSQALPLVQIADDRRLRLVMIVPEAAVPQLRIGSDLDIQIPALQKSVRGRIARFTQSVDAGSRTMEVEANVPNAGGTIAAGMAADILVRTATPQQVLAVPQETVARRGGQTFVMLVKPDGTVEERQVETGLENSSHVQIRAGLSGGDAVVTGSKTLIRAGQRVEVKAEPTS